MSKRIQVALATPSEPARAVTIPYTMEVLQWLIGGYLEATVIAGLDGLTAYVNEDGHSLNMAPCRRLSPHGTILGPIVVSKADANGCEVGLTDEEAAMAVRVLDAGRGD